MNMLSVVICTHNRSEHLKKCLIALEEQTIKNFETIIVDNNSTDNTRDVAMQFCAKYGHRSIYCFEHKTGLSHARNTGYIRASGEYIAYIDDDAYADEHWCENILKAINEHQFDVCGGYIKPLYEVNPPFWFNEKLIVKNIKKKSLIPKHKAVRGIGFIGANIIFKKEHLVNFKGFNTDLGMKGKNLGLGEETELCKRIAQEHNRFLYDPDIKVTHFIPAKYVTFKYYAKRRFKSGSTNLLMCRGNLKIRVLKKVCTLLIFLIILPLTLLAGPIKNLFFINTIGQIIYRLGFLYKFFFNKEVVCKGR